MNSILDGTTVAFFRERLRKSGVIEQLFEMFESYLRSQGLQDRDGQIIDATLVPVARQHNIQEENKEIKAGRLPDGWNGINYYGYKNSICIDVDHGFIRRYAVTPANVHDSQMLPHLLDPKEEHVNVWEDSAYSAECFESLLSLGGFESPIHEKGARNHPISDAAEELNPIKSAIRACVKHVFGSMTMSMVRKLSRKASLERTEVRQGLKKLTCNFLRYLQRTSNAAIFA